MKNSVENNLLGGSEWLQTDKTREHGADVLSCNDNPSGEACKRGLAENKAYAAALATSSVALLPGSAQAMWLLGAGTNAGMQYADSGEINPVNSVAAGWINVITMGQGWKGTIAWNAAGGALTNAINGDDPLTGAITNGAGAGLAPGRTIGQNVGIAAGSAFFTDGPDTGSIGGAAAGAWAGGLFGEYAPGIVNSLTGKEVPGFIFDATDSFGSEILGGYVKDAVESCFQATKVPV